jgi:hypothetical protein
MQQGTPVWDSSDLLGSVISNNHVRQSRVMRPERVVYVLDIQRAGWFAAGPTLCNGRAKDVNCVVALMFAELQAVF